MRLRRRRWPGQPVYEDLPSRARRRVVVGIVAAGVAALPLAVSLFGPEDRVSLNIPTGPTLPSDAVPFVDRPPPAFSPPTTTTLPPPPAIAPACKAGNLTVDVAQSDGGDGHIKTVLTFTNLARSTCLLAGSPLLSGITRSGRRVPLDAGSVTPYGDPGPPADLAQDDAAQVFIDTATSCGNAGETSGVPAYRRFSVELPSGGRIDVEGELDVNCGISVSPFGVPQPPPPPAVPPPGSMGLLNVTIDVPAQYAGSLDTRIRVGDRLRFLVTLANPGDVAVPLRPCPGYVVDLGVTNGVPIAKVGHALNCDRIKSIPAGGRVRYVIELTIPMSAPEGDATLRWTLQAPFAPSASDVFAIVRG